MWPVTAVVRRGAGGAVAPWPQAGPSHPGPQLTHPSPTTYKLYFQKTREKNHATSINLYKGIGLGQIVRPFIHSILQKVAAASSRYPGAQLTHPSPTTYTRSNSIISENAQKITQPRLINLYKGRFGSECPSIYTFHSSKSGCCFIQIFWSPAYPFIRHQTYPQEHYFFRKRAKNHATSTNKFL
jgi:hypothetical protein